MFFKTLPMIICSKNSKSSMGIFFSEVFQKTSQYFFFCLYLRALNLFLLSEGVVYLVRFFIASLYEVWDFLCASSETNMCNCCKFSTF